ncbi:MAG: hypothetical protein AAB403_01015 [Planctomycetota bacterium]
MAGRTINLFMWGYQDSYRIHVQILARNTLKELGAEPNAEVLLVGARRPGSMNRNQVCVEPESGKWPLSIFEGLLDSVESIYEHHDLQHMFYSDEASMRDKPEWMRRDSVRTSVTKALVSFDAEENVISFAGSPRLVGDYYVTPIIQIPSATFSQFPPLPPCVNSDDRRGYGFRSLTHAAMSAVLKAATKELESPDPGRFTHGSMRDAEEIVRIAAKDFLHTPGLSIERQYTYTDLFDTLNLVSSLMYEGGKGVGQLVLANPESEAVEFLAKFSQPIPFREPRWVRKILQMATAGVGLVANSSHILGLGNLKRSYDPSRQDAFTVAFIDHYQWELLWGRQVLIRSHYAVPKLPQEHFDKASFSANYSRLFPASSPEDADHLWNLLQVQVRQDHGSMLVVAEDAAAEAYRLSKQGTNITPTRLSETLLQSVSGIDGTILLDPHGNCHAIGVILDGEASDACTPSRGSRYNSGVRYVQASLQRRFAIVVSDDRTVDLIPPLRRLVSRKLLEQHVATFASATLDDYHDSRNWLDNHRFYINAEQCSRLNAAIARLDSSPKEVGRIYLGINLFQPNSEMDDSYLVLD